MITRTCSRCREELPEDSFRYQVTRQRFYSYCKSCEHEYKIEWQRRNSEKRAGYASQDRRRHPERFKGYDKKNRQIRTATQVKRRALENTIFEDIDRMVVYKRDEGVCQICEKPVGADEFQLDHVVPIIEGGPHLYTNVQVAHGTCNRRKGRKMLLEGATP